MTINLLAVLHLIAFRAHSLTTTMRHSNASLAQLTLERVAGRRRAVKNNLNGPRQLQDGPYRAGPRNENMQMGRADKCQPLQCPGREYCLDRPALLQNQYCYSVFVPDIGIQDNTGNSHLKPIIYIIRYIIKYLLICNVYK